MLDESGFSLEEMREIYDYYYEDLAMIDIRDMTNNFFTWRSTHSSAESALEDFRRNDVDCKVSKDLRYILTNQEWLKWLAMIQAFIFIAIAVTGCIKGTPVQFILNNALPLVLSWFLALSIAKNQKRQIEREEDMITWDIVGGVVARELDDLAYDRTWAAYSIQNTWLMYDVLKKRIEENSPNKEKTA